MPVPAVACRTEGLPSQAGSPSASFPCGARSRGVSESVEAYHDILPHRLRFSTSKAGKAEKGMRRGGKRYDAMCNKEKGGKGKIEKER
jgi:hypothetical protein